jgi:hypothetical protein
MSAKRKGNSTDSRDSIYIYDDKPGDKTIRPMGPDFPRGRPRPRRPGKKPPLEQPPNDKS